MTRKFHNGNWDGKSVFVFGSNLAGRHGAGAAKFAMQHCGAVYGQGIGRQGNSYAIPTKNEKIYTLPLDCIAQHVESFTEYAMLSSHKHELFFVTAIGTGLAGYSHEQISPMFAYVPENCILPIAWKEFV